MLIAKTKAKTKEKTKANNINWQEELGEIVEGYENIIVTEIEGHKYLVLSEAQYTELANHIEKLKAKNKRKDEKLEQAKEEIKKAYDTKTSMSFRDLLTGAGVASLLIILTQGGD